jgi:hypothetical protein
MTKTRSAYVGGAAAIVMIAATMALRPEEVSDPDRIPAAARSEIKAVELEIDRIEAESLNKSRSTTLDLLQDFRRVDSGNRLSHR